MSALVWDQIGERFYETGTDKAVLYPYKNSAYQTGVAWNGITAVTESPSGAEATPLYADNIKYLNLMSAEEFGMTIEAYTYPDEWAECDGSAAPSTGVKVGQQKRIPFGFCFRTRHGNDADGTDKGYKLHLIYNCLASPSERSYATINDSPEAITFSWEVTTTPTAFTTNAFKDLYKPTACIVIDSTTADPTKLAALEAQLYGRDADAEHSIEAIEPNLPSPDAVLAMFAQG